MLNADDGDRFEILRKSRNKITALRIKPLGARRERPKPESERTHTRQDEDQAPDR